MARNLDIWALLEAMGMRVDMCKCGCGRQVIVGRGRQYWNDTCATRDAKRKSRGTKHPRAYLAEDVHL